MQKPQKTGELIKKEYCENIGKIYLGIDESFNNPFIEANKNNVFLVPLKNKLCGHYFGKKFQAFLAR
jgi:hypothetical protein